MWTLNGGEYGREALEQEASSNEQRILAWLKIVHPVVENQPGDG
jgi:hypothetical protein